VHLNDLQRGPTNPDEGSPPSRACGYTTRELARLLRVSPDRIRCWIQAGELGAIDTARHRCGRPRYVILPHHLDEFQRRRAAYTPAAPKRRPRRSTGAIDYYADTPSSGN
jgi:excisionase family DNA binding protein